MLITPVRRFFDAYQWQQQERQQALWFCSVHPEKMIAVQVQQCLKDVEVFIVSAEGWHVTCWWYAPLLASLVLPVYCSLSGCERWFWSAPWGDGFWETEVLLSWKNMGQQYLDWEEKQYLVNYRMSKETFWFLCERYRVLLRKQETKMWQPIYTVCKANGCHFALVGTKCDIRPAGCNVCK